MASQGSMADKPTRLLMVEAIKYSNIAKVQQLLNEGFNLNRPIKYKDGDWLRSYTPLCVAIAHGSIQLVRLFITSGANVNKSVSCHKSDHQEKFTPLFLACREGQLQIIDLLIQAGALVNVPLSGARIQEEEGGSIDYSDSRNTCLHWATVYRKYDLLEQLLQRGGNPSLLNSHQETPLHLACDTYNPPIIRLLARTGGVAANKDIHSTTPLFSLMFHRGDPAEQIELVKLLLAGGYVLTEETWLNQVRNYLYDATSAGSEEANQNAALVGGQLMATHNRESVELLKSRYGVAFLQWLLDWGTNPHRLKYLCRQAIRDTVGSIDLLQKVRQLPLPLSLINYLQLDQM